MGPRDVGHGELLYRIGWDSTIGDLIPGLFELAMWVLHIFHKFAIFFWSPLGCVGETFQHTTTWRADATLLQISRVRDEVVSFFASTNRPWHHAFKIHTLARTKDARTVYSIFWIASLPSTGHVTWQNLRRTAETVRAEVTQAWSRDW